MSEVWKSVPGYNNKYEVSNLGEVRNAFTKRILAFDISSRYRRVYLIMGKQKDAKIIHRLVAEAFVPNTYNKPYVNHLNGDKFDNHWKNLQWCTHLENMTHARLTGLIKPSQCLSVRVRRDSIHLIIDGKIVTTVDSLMELQELLNA